MLRITTHVLCTSPVPATLHQASGHQQLAGRQRLLMQLYALWAEALLPGLVACRLLPELEDLHMQPGSSVPLR